MLSSQSVDPNFPEISGTTLPLLAGVLAGFAVTSIVQLALSPDRGTGLSTSTEIAIAILLLSVVCFLNSIVFAIKAQASNYLPFLDLSERALKLLNVRDMSAWIRDLERRWFLFQIAAIGSFYCGAALFLAGLNLIVWVYVSPVVGIVFLAASIVMVASAVLLDVLGTAWVQGKLRHSNSEKRQ
jgi:hypothetical protein